MVEPSRAGLVAASPDAPSPVMFFGQVAAGDQVEQAFDLGDGEWDQPGIGGWWLVGPGGQRRRWPVAGGCCGVGDAQTARAAMASTVWRSRAV